MLVLTTLQHAKHIFKILVKRYTKSLVNADSFYANFNKGTFQKRSKNIYLTQIPSLTPTVSEKKSQKVTSNHLQKKKKLFCCSVLVQQDRQ